MPPLVSVLIPTYNRAGYLDEAVRSALGQTYPHTELIVVDDGSTDDTASVAARYAPRVRYVWQPNSERGAARNHGLRLAGGDFVAFLDSDDLWTPDKLERDLRRFRERPEAGLVYADAELIDGRGRRIRIRRTPRREGWVTADLLVENFVVLSSHLARAEAVRTAGGFREERGLSGSEDWELWVRLSTRWPFAHVASPTARYRVHGANSMGDPGRMARSMSAAYAVFESADYLTPAQRRTFPRTRSMIALFAAIDACGDDLRPLARARLVESVRHSPRTALDPRFAYTLLRSVWGPRVSSAVRAYRAFWQHSLSFRPPSR